VTDLEVRRWSNGDRAQLDELGGESVHEAAHHRERAAMQDGGEATYLLAWRGGAVVGRVTLLRSSKYANVRAVHGAIWEMNALEARQPGRGIGTGLIVAAEHETAAAGQAILGLAVEPGNDRARRLYDRLGYADWGHGPVVDEWTEHDDVGRVVQEHRDRCDYLIKVLS
jgi:ribosomal protein S18 acetylase RimI-like enzyme